ncbi:MAG: twin-arginine translocase subunit TatC [Thermoplasmata archaeon]
MGDLHRILTVLTEVRRRLFRLAIVLVPIFGFLLVFKIVFVPWTLGPISMMVPVPYPSLFYNVSAQIFGWLVTDMLPSGVQLLNIGVGDSVMVQLEIALLVTLALGMPWIAHELGAFLVPALRANERRLIRNIAIPASGLFLAGTLAGLFVLTPFTYLILFEYVSALGIPASMGVQNFVTFTLLYSVAFGVVCELPVFIYALTRLGVVPAAAWRKHWRAAVIGSLIFGMLITPDNSGITMCLIALPMMGLYFGGAYFARRFERQRARRRAGPVAPPVAG